jgi:hypothetical protein
VVLARPSAVSFNVASKRRSSRMSPGTKVSVRQLYTQQPSSGSQDPGNVCRYVQHRIQAGIKRSAIAIERRNLPGYVLHGSLIVSGCRDLSVCQELPPTYTESGEFAIRPLLMNAEPSGARFHNGSFKTDVFTSQLPQFRVLRLWSGASHGRTLYRGFACGGASISSSRTQASQTERNFRVRRRSHAVEGRKCVSS